MKDDSRFNELMSMGRIAFAQDDYEKAHELWRQAATQNPFSEEVWQSLLTVVKTYPDRYVCLQNIVKINPNNEDAVRQMKGLGLILGKFTGDDDKKTSSLFQFPHVSSALRILLRGIKTLIIMILLFMTGLGIGLLLNELMLR